MKKIISLFLALVMVLSVLALAACSKEEPKTTGGGDIQIITEEKKDDPNDIYDADVKNLHEHEFKFITKKSTASHLTTNEVYAEALNGETINDAVYKRNSSIENAYNCKITEINTANPTGEYRAALTAGEYVCDVMFDTVYRANVLSQTGLICDLNSFDNLNLDKNWWDQNYREAMTFNGKCFFGAGDACTLDDRATWILMFNKELFEMNDVELPYTAVSEGTWTIDKFVEIINKTAAEKDGNSVMEYGKDYFGYVGESFNAWVHVAACKERLAVIDENEISIPDSINEGFMNAWNAIKPIMTSPNYWCGDDSIQFKKGLVTFYGINAGMLVFLNNATIEYGVIPFPKMTADQDHYYSTVSSSIMSAYFIPTTAEEAPDAQSNGFKDGAEQAAYLLEAFAYTSRDTLTIAFYDQVLLRQSCKDPESRKMVEKAFEYKMYDPLLLLRWGNIAKNLYLNCCAPAGQVGTSATNWDNISSSYETDLGAARTEMNAYFDYLDTL